MHHSSITAAVKSKQTVLTVAVTVEILQVPSATTAVEMQKSQPEQPADICIIADSWLSKARMENCFESGTNRVEISPHINANGGCSWTVNNLSKGSRAITDVLRDGELLLRWVETRPSVTILHVFACDVVNRRKKIVPPSGTSIGTFYSDYVAEALQAMLHFAEQHMSAIQFGAWAAIHRFLVPALPDWKDFKQTRKGSMAAKEYRHFRMKINKVLKSKRIRFWRQYKALVIHPCMSNVEMVGVHLTPEFQAIFNEYILKSVASLLCGKCALKPEATVEELCKAVEGAGCDSF